MQIADNSAFDNLAYGVLAQAATEARGGDLSACIWLQTEGPFWLEALGSDIEEAASERFIDEQGILKTV